MERAERKTVSGLKPADGRALVAACALVALGFGGASARAQCGWLPETRRPDANVLTMIMWDSDGPGVELPRLTVAGQFHHVGLIHVDHITTYDPEGDEWAILEQGIELDVHALAGMPNGDLIAGGFFPTASSRPASNIARWDRTMWQPLGAGTNFPVYALAVLPNGDLIAAGAFTMAGEVAVQGIARWNGTAWSSMDFPSPAVFNALAVLPNGDLIAGGEIAAPEFRNLARWDGATWTGVGEGVNNIVHALQPLAGGRLAVGGLFTIAGASVPSHGVAVWDGSTWTGLGVDPVRTPAPAANHRVMALAALANGDLIAGGFFTDIAGVRAPKIARWNGAYWSPVAAMTNGTVEAIVQMPDGMLAAGGSFSYAGLPSGTRFFARTSLDGPGPVVRTPPTGAVICGRGTARISVGVESENPVWYHWRLGGVPIPASANATAITSTLEIASPTLAAEGAYDCIVTNACGTTLSLSANLRVCFADLDDGTATGVCDGGVTTDDLLYYVDQFAQGQAVADLDDGTGTGVRDGGVTIDDLLFFLVRFEGGC